MSYSKQSPKRLRRTVLERHFPVSTRSEDEKNAQEVPPSSKTQQIMDIVIFCPKKCSNIVLALIGSKSETAGPFLLETS
jgi:hypothetical protein